MSGPGGKNPKLDDLSTSDRSASISDEQVTGALSPDILILLVSDVMQAAIDRSAGHSMQERKWKAVETTVATRAEPAMTFGDGIA